ncbi:interleukin-1 receptor-associated kinase 4 [Elysia marginata]|uniref:Interleukin-1 receptor-associated kinase 4 n=1 Tax=Elysia marginata TaxID=1093978 RepID=A0AAV4EZT7_9GAST|nr:interleukin-1 receptor-associated kinase 4 [Elysia marginata]
MLLLVSFVEFKPFPGTAKGIEFLHQNGLVHRDIKSANILLDEDLTPKVGDFATARGTTSSMTTKILLSSKIIGTQVYLAPEAYAGQIHIGLDCYSFGVVLLEILTGLAVLDVNRKEHDLKTYVQEHMEEEEEDDEEDEDDEEGHMREKKEPGTIFDLLDVKAGDWKAPMVELFYGIANKCLEISVKKRAKMKQVVKWLDVGTMGK